jgi:hypothetical protein
LPTETLACLREAQVPGLQGTLAQDTAIAPRNRFSSATVVSRGLRESAACRASRRSEKPSARSRRRPNPSFATKVNEGAGRGYQDFGAEHGVLTQAWSPIGGVAFDRDGSHVGTLTRISQMLGSWAQDGCGSSGQADPPGRYPAI